MARRLGDGPVVVWSDDGAVTAWDCDDFRRSAVTAPQMDGTRSVVLRQVVWLMAGWRECLG